MLLDQLRSRAIRGIGPELQLNLSARVTLIHAPNGTAKTSLCDAVEWLFTGEIARLHDALSKSEGKGVPNVCWPKLVPFAECELRIGSEHLRARREGVAEPNRVQLTKGTNWQETSLDELLSRLTPGALPASANVLQRLKSRRSWFRAVRFLEAHALDLLLDSSVEGNEVRDLVFCDLFGIGELERAKRDLGKIVKELQSKTALTRDIRAAKAEIKRMEAEIQAATVRASTPIIESFRTQLAMAAQHFGLSVEPAPASRHTQLATVQNAYALAVERLASQHVAFAAVDASANRYTALGAELAVLAKRQQDITAERAQAQRTLEPLVVAQQRADSDAAKAESLVQSLAAFPLDSVEAKLQRALHQWRSSGGDADVPMDLNAAESTLAARREDRSRSQVQLAALAQCETALPLWREARVREEAAAHKIANLPLPTAQERANAERTLGEARAAHAQVETSYARLAGPIEQLRAAGRGFLADAPAEHRCPLCAHDHGSAEALKEAIAAGVAALPEAVESVAARKGDIEQRIAGLEQKMRAWDEARRAVELATTDLAAARQTLGAASPTLAALGIRIDEIGNGDIEAHLRALRLSIEAEVAQRERLVIELERRVNSICELRDVAEELAALSDRVRGRLPDVPVVRDVADRPPGQWPLAVERIAAAVQTAATEARGQAEVAKRKADESRIALASAKQKVDALAAAAREASQQVGAAQTERSKFEAQWRVLAGDEPWTPAASEMQPARLAHAADEIANAKQELVSASAALANAAEAAGLVRNGKTVFSESEV
jgi:DNA repair exonuclease SbcCD ATPase subunit